MKDKFVTDFSLFDTNVIASLRHLKSWGSQNFILRGFNFKNLYSILKSAMSFKVFMTQFVYFIIPKTRFTKFPWSFSFSFILAIRFICLKNLGLMRNFSNFYLGKVFTYFLTSFIPNFFHQLVFFHSLKVISQNPGWDL